MSFIPCMTAMETEVTKSSNENIAETQYIP